jgi:hypothetical protein
METATYTICTEENPQINEIAFILNHLKCNCKVTGLTANITANKWNGSFDVTTDDPNISVCVKLVKGHGSFVDYIVYDHPDPNEKTSVPILLLESTKTSDSESRNTAINQRFTKFAVAKQRFPNVPLVLYYNTEQNTTTQTSLFGRRLMATYGVKIYDLNGKDMLVDAPPFTTVDEIIKEKNNFKEKKGNISIKITETAPHTYTINAKLSKGENTTICHDPNKGLITGIASSIFSLDKEAKFIITNHCVDTSKIKKTSDKFWYANNQYDLKLDGCEVSSQSATCPDTYWTNDITSEKASTIIYQNYMEKNKWKTIYHNHSSSARSYFTDQNNEEHQVPKDITIPDIVMVNKKEKRIIICEGKIEKDYMMGVRQLDNQTKFIEYVEKYYKYYTIERGLCLYVKNLTVIESIQEKIPYTILFALDSSGTFCNKTSL